MEGEAEQAALAAGRDAAREVQERLSPDRPVALDDADPPGLLDDVEASGTRPVAGDEQRAREAAGDLGDGEGHAVGDRRAGGGAGRGGRRSGALGGVRRPRGGR